MKWLLLVFVFSTTGSDFNLSIQREIEIETEELCKQAQKRLIERVKSNYGGFNGICIQVRE